MSNNTKSIIKSVFITVLGSASVYVYGQMVTDYVVKEIEAYFE